VPVRPAILVSDGEAAPEAAPKVMGRVGDWFCGPARGLCPRELWGRYSDKPCFLRSGITETQQTVNDGHCCGQAFVPASQSAPKTEYRSFRADSGPTAMAMPLSS
jgi:hypothetical protein